MLCFMGAPSVTTAASNATEKPIIDMNSGAYFASNTVFADGNINVRLKSGAVSSVRSSGAGSYSGTGSYTKISPASMLDRSSICLGDGNTPVTYEDYTLSGALLNTSYSSITAIHGITMVWDSENKKFTKTATVTYLNNTTSEQTIREYGLFHENRQATVTSSSRTTGIERVTAFSDTCVLMFREVLEEPIVVAAGNSATFRISIDFPMPNHP